MCVEYVKARGCVRIEKVDLLPQRAARESKATEDRRVERTFRYARDRVLADRTRREVRVRFSMSAAVSGEAFASLCRGEREGRSQWLRFVA